MDEHEVDASTSRLRFGWWTWVRLAAVGLVVWAAYGFFMLSDGYTKDEHLAFARSQQAAQLAGVPLTVDEARFTAFPPTLPTLRSGNRADQIVALDGLSASESASASDILDATIAAGTAGLGSLAIFIAGLRSAAIHVGAVNRAQAKKPRKSARRTQVKPARA